MYEHIVDNTRDTYRGTGVRKVTNSKSDLQGHSKAPVMMPFDRPHTTSC